MGPAPLPLIIFLPLLVTAAAIGTVGALAQHNPLIHPQTRPCNTSLCKHCGKESR